MAPFLSVVYMYSLKKTSTFSVPGKMGFLFFCVICQYFMIQYFSRTTLFLPLLVQVS